MSPADVTVIGAGIVGSLAACLLCDRGLRVRLVDLHGKPMSAASRWNEGKLHLGYTYTGTESLHTARLMTTGTAHFERVIRKVCGKGLDQRWWSSPIAYVVDKDSIFTVEHLWKRARAVGELVRDLAARHESISHFEPLTPQRLTSDETGALNNGKRKNAAAWITGERSLSTKPISDMVTAAVQEREIELYRGRVLSVRRQSRRWTVQCGGHDGALESHGLINCSWESRWLLDRLLNRVASEISIRYKVALFGSNVESCSCIQPSTRILGAFGDVTPYGDGNIYLSWYPAGLLAQSELGPPPEVVNTFDPEAIVLQTLSALGLEALGSHAWTVKGGFVVAAGRGSITDPNSTLHERCHAGAWLLAPNYVSVDTGKYTLGPLLAEKAVDLLLSTWSQE